MLNNPYGVYPRVCGGTQLAVFMATLDQGLSPRVRGNPMRGGAMAACLGSIPACAGEPQIQQSSP